MFTHLRKCAGKAKCTICKFGDDSKEAVFMEHLKQLEASEELVFEVKNKVMRPPPKHNSFMSNVSIQP